MAQKPLDSRNLEIWTMEAQAKATQCEDLLISTQAENERLRAVNAELVAALNDIVTQFPLVYGVPVPAWIRNGDIALSHAKAKGQA